MDTIGVHFIMNKQKLIQIGVFGFVIYLLASALSYGAFSFFGQKKSNTVVVTSPLPSAGGGSPKMAKYKIDASLPRTQECPLNGMMYTEKEKGIWEKRRPLAVSVENSLDARPQSGLSLADVVYEVVAEGGVTRFLALFHCGASLGNIPVAPVRSARTYLVTFVSEYDSLFNHVGGANTLGDNAQKTDPRADAMGQISRFGIRDLDQYGISYPDCFRNYDRLDHTVATEHTMVCMSDNLFKVADKRGYGANNDDGTTWEKEFTKWKFKDDTSESERRDQKQISFGFWSGYNLYDVTWNYDKPSNTYKRVNGGKPHTDLETGEQLTAKNVVIQFAKEQRSVDANVHNLYEIIGEGKGLAFQDGNAIPVTWKKATRTARTKFLDPKGKEIIFNRGPIWIEIVPSGNEVVYK